RRWCATRPNVSGCQETCDAIEYPSERLPHRVQRERRSGSIGLSPPSTSAGWTDVQLASRITEGRNSERREEFEVWNFSYVLKFFYRYPSGRSLSAGPSYATSLISMTRKGRSRVASSTA